MRQIEKENVFREQLFTAYSLFFNQLEKSIEQLEKDVDEAAHMSNICTDEWCAAIEHVVDELHKAVYSISEPHNAPEEYKKRLTNLRRRLKELYVRYKAVSSPRTMSAAS